MNTLPRLCRCLVGGLLPTLLGVLPEDACGQYQWSNLAGQPGGLGTVDGTAGAARFNYPYGVAADAAGNLYVADSSNNTIRMATPAGVVTTLAGSPGVYGSKDGAGGGAQFASPTGVAVDSSGNIYVADSGNNTIRKVSASGVVTTLAGSPGSSGSTDGQGSAARFYYPTGLTLDVSGNIYVADQMNGTIRKVVPDGTVTTLAGAAGSPGSADGLGSAARFRQPTGVAVDASGNVFVADANNNTIRKITPGGQVSTLAGGADLPPDSLDGVGVAARFNLPTGVALDGGGNLYVADQDNQTIRKVGADGTVTTLAGSPGVAGSTNGTGAAAQFNGPTGVVASGGNVFVADASNNTIREVSPAGVVSTFAGSALSNGSADGLAAAARFTYLNGVAADSGGNVYVADFGNNTLRKVSATGLVTTLAGSPGNIGSSDGTGSNAQFNGLSGVAVDGDGNIYVADTSNCTIREVSPDGVVTTLAGTPGISGTTDGPGGVAQFNSPTGVAVDGSGNVYIADASNNTIRKLSAGVVTTLAGSAGFGGSDDGSGSAARFFIPIGVAADADGNVYVADSGNNVIRKISPAGDVVTLAGSPGLSGSADGTGASARFSFPDGIAVDGDGNVFVSDNGNSTIRMVTPAGVVTTIGGSAGVVGGADGLGAAAQFSGPGGIAVDAAGKVYVGDTSNNRVVEGVPVSLVPAMIVQQPVGTSLINGASLTDFGTAVVGTSVTMTYVIQNQGRGSLTGLSITTSGPNASDFTASTLGATIVPPGGSLSFIVTFAPAARGSHKALLQIASNDPSHNPFGILLVSGLPSVVNDTTPPTIRVTSPSATLPLSALSPCTVAGTAADASGIARVEIALNGGPAVNAVLGVNGFSSSMPFSLPVAPVNGRNSLAVTAFDLRGNQTTLTTSFSFTRRYVLAVNRSVPDGVDLDAAGRVTLSAAPSTNASALSPATANTNKTAAVVPGTSVTLTATAKAGYVFGQWSGLPPGAVTLGNVAAFTMPAAAVAVTAIYVANPFTGAPGTGNVFAGLIHASGGTVSTNATEGFLSGTLTPGSGVFTGKVVIAGAVQPVTATFYGDGSSLFAVGSSKQASLSFSGGTLTLGFGSAGITATIANGSNTSTGVASRAIYSAVNTVPGSLLNIAVPVAGPNNRGVFNVVFPSRVQNPVMASSTYPQGDGFGTLTVLNTGVVAFAGTLADGTAITGSSIIVADNTCPLFVQLATPGSSPVVRGGSFGGMVTFDALQLASDVSSSDFLWFRPAAAAGTATLYPGGWSAGVHVSALGALYNKAVDVQTALGLGPVDTTNGNGVLHFSNGKLAPDVRISAFNIAPGASSTASVVTKIPVRNATFTLSALQTTGSFSGTFTPNWRSPAAAKPAFKGILIQKGAKGGYGFFLSNVVGDTAPESGTVTLGALGSSL